MATLTDEILDLNDRLIGSFFTKAKNKYDKTFAESGKAINDKVRLYGEIGAALIEAKASGADPYAAIESVLPWEAFTTTVQEARQLAREENFDHLRLVAVHYSQLRRYEPAFPDLFEFRGAPVAQPLLDAIGTLREMNEAKARKVPEMTPTGLIRKRWEPFVYTREGRIGNSTSSRRWRS
jgi:hypothetical protein